MNKEEQREKWRHNKTKSWKAFRAVMDHYYECKANLGACQPVNYNSNGGSHGYVVGKVIMLPADFLCDVELTAKRVLDAAQLKYFRDTYLGKEPHVQTSINMTDIKVQEILGNEFFKVGMFPISKYIRTIRKF